MLNHLWWTRYFRETYIPQAQSLVQTLETRLLPTFDDINSEATKVADETWGNLQTLPGGENVDMGDLAEIAHEAGLEHYMMMSGLRQGLTNMFAAALYHLYEQQVLEFHRRELLDLSDENDKKQFNHRIFQERLRDHGIDVKTFGCWPILDELRLLANTVKHADGSSAEQLHALRPDIFVAPAVRGLPFLGTTTSPPVFAPLMGEDVYVSLDDIRRYRDAVVQFWVDLSNAIAIV